MPNRMIKETIRTSRAVNSISDFQFRLWLYLITYVDDYGRGSADPELLHGLLFPRRKAVTENQIKAALDALEDAGLIIRYEDEEGEQYLYFPKWADHQRIQQKKPKFPDPPPYVTVSHGESRCNSVNDGESPLETKPIETKPIRNQKETNSFIAPRLEDVIAYAEQRNSSVDPQRFFDYFEAGGWKDAKGNPVKNWKQKFITWESKQNGVTQRPTKEPVKHDWDDINFYDN